MADDQTISVCFLTGSVIDVPISSSVAVIQPKKPRGKPFPKGVSGNPKGKPKGTIQIKDELRKILTKENAKDVAANIIKEAIAGDDKKQDRLLKLTGDLSDTPQSTVNNNTIIGDDVLQSAIEYLKQKNLKVIP